MKALVRRYGPGHCRAGCWATLDEAAIWNRIRLGWTLARGATIMIGVITLLSARLQSGWYPQLVDYLALSFNTSTAFSPSDVSAVRHWSKLLMMMEAAMSLTILVLVVARAVNVL